MNDWVKRGLLGVIFAVAAQRGFVWWKGNNAHHQMMFRAEGPTSCQVQIRYDADTPMQDNATLEWASPVVETHGHTEVSLTIDIPLSCGWQPSQVHCFIDRDGVAWKQSEATRVTDTRDGTTASYRCEINARATE
jgi:hypothetical protein